MFILKAPEERRRKIRFLRRNVTRQSNLSFTSFIILVPLETKTIRISTYTKVIKKIKTIKTLQGHLSGSKLASYIVDKKGNCVVPAGLYLFPFEQAMGLCLIDVSIKRHFHFILMLNAQSHA